MSRRQVSKVVKFETFIFEIVEWEPSYSFSLNTTTWPPGPYREHLQLTCRGKLLIPSKLGDRIVVFHILGDRAETAAVQNPQESGLKPLVVGSINLRGQQSDYLGSIPFDGLCGMLTMLAAGKVRYISLHGNALSRGAARIRSIMFAPTFNREDYE